MFRITEHIQCQKIDASHGDSIYHSPANSSFLEEADPMAASSAGPGIGTAGFGGGSSEAYGARRASKSESDERGRGVAAVPCQL